MRVPLKIMLAGLTIAGVYSCNRSPIDSPDVAAEIEITGLDGMSISFEASSTAETSFSVKSNYPWKLKGSNLEWALFNPADGVADVSVTVTVAPRTVNENGRRMGYLTVEAKDKVVSITVSQDGASEPQPPEPDDTSVTVDGHPRLLLDAEGIPVMKARIMVTPMLLRLHNYIMGIADQTLSEPVNERVLSGHRLLDISVSNMTRIFYCSYAYRMTGERRYSNRAAAEMLAAAAFEDWNPAHFLDCAEMTMGVALGYDWCYPALTPEERVAIKKGLVDHGLTPGMMENGYTDWQYGDNNWNQVCNACLLYGALAVVEDHPEYAEYLCERAVRTIPIVMKAYDPHGAYPEGPAYWCYGTGYNVLLLALMKDYYGTDFGLMEAHPAFAETVDYSLAVITPTLQNFSYMDQKFSAQLSVVPFWFYSETGDASYLYMQKQILENRTALSISDCHHQRMLPAALVFGSRHGDLAADIPKPSWLGYAAGGISPIAVFRSDWGNATDVYLGFKSGTPNFSHGHMDVGSFYFEADGVRWAVELGGENYTRIEQAGVDLWNYSQESPRWDLLRLGVQGHNCLMFDGGKQAAAEGAGITDFSVTGDHLFAVADLSAMYRINGISSVRRAVSLVNGKYAVVQDKITTGALPVTVRWAMCTEAASVAFPESGKMVLEKSKKQLHIRIDGVEAATSNWSAQPPQSYEGANTGKQFVGFHADLDAGKTYEITVYLMPGEELTGLEPPYVFN